MITNKTEAGSKTALRLLKAAGAAIAFTMLLSQSSIGQCPIPAIADLPAQASRPQLQQTRESLLERRGQLKSRAEKQKSACGAVIQGSPEEAPCRAFNAELNADICQYAADVRAFNSEVARVPTAENCRSARQRKEVTRRAIERQMQSGELNAEELAAWTAASEQARKDALRTALIYVVGRFAEDIDPLRKSVDKLEHRVEKLEKAAIFSKKKAARLKYLIELRKSLDDLQPKKLLLMAKNVGQTAEDAETIWKLSRNTMESEFRVAGNRDEHLQAVLRDPEFKEAFTGDDLGNPGEEVVEDLAEHSLDEAAKFLTKASTYEQFTGQALKSAVFIRDAWYDAFLAAESAELVLQHSDLAGALAKSSGVIQKQYRADIDELKECQKAGY